jgi:hypothetical protein
VADATAQDDLLAEQVGLGLFLEGGLEHTGAGAADAPGVGEADGVGLTGDVLVNGDECRNPGALGVGAPHQVTGALGGDHQHVDVGGRGDGIEVDVEAVGEHERLAGPQVRLDVRLVDARHVLVGDQQHDHVGPFGGLADVHHGEPGVLGLGAAGGPGTEPDHHLDTRFPQVVGMGVTLAAVADDRHLAVLDERGVGIALVVDRRHQVSSVGVPRHACFS